MESAGNALSGVSGLRQPERAACRAGRWSLRFLRRRFGLGLVCALRYMGALRALTHALAGKPCINEKGVCIDPSCLNDFVKLEP